MKKVAIVTLYGENNYGNRLQNYAVQKTLEKMGCEVETIVAIEKSKQKRSLKFYIANILAETLPCIVKRINADFIRHKSFKNFTKKYIPTRYILTEGTFPNSLNDEYDYYVAGSDQIWNPNFRDVKKNYYNMFLRFVPKDKRICFSPSIGVSKLPDEWIEKFTEGFNGFNELSVREETGARIIKELSGKDAKVLIDPTLMFDKDEWLKVSKKSKAPKKPYVLEYFLGERDNEKLNAIAKENNLSRVTLLDRNNSDIYVSGPGEFIDLVSKADMICTDSFHACVFSILFGKPFIVYKRKDKTQDMYSRIDSLLNLFNVESNGKPIIVSPKLRDEVLKIERKKVFDFLKRNMCM